MEEENNIITEENKANEDADTNKKEENAKSENNENIESSNEINNKQEEENTNTDKNNEVAKESNEAVPSNTEIKEQNTTEKIEEKIEEKANNENQEEKKEDNNPQQQPIQQENQIIESKKEETPTPNIEYLKEDKTLNNNITNNNNDTNNEVNNSSVDAKENLAAQKDQIKEGEIRLPKAKRKSTSEQNPIQRKLPKLIQSQLSEIAIINSKLVEKTKKNKTCSINEFFTKKRHYIIMTDGGKPVYSRYGDEVENCGIFATLSAMITKFTVFLSGENEKEILNFIRNENSLIAFLKKGQLIFIAFCRSDENQTLLYSQLGYLFHQLLSILTTHFYERLEDNPSQCLMAMSGTDVLFENMIKITHNSFISIFDSYPVLPFDYHDQVLKICNENRGCALLCIILTPNEIIAISHNENVSVTASDIILLLNLIHASPSVREQSWVPFCLPGISPVGYLQLYCNFNECNIGVCFVTESTEPEYFMKFVEQDNDIIDCLEDNGLIDKILQAEIDLTHIEDDEVAKEKNENKIHKSIEEMTDEELVEELIKKLENKEGVKPSNSDVKKADKGLKRLYTVTAPKDTKHADTFGVTIMDEMIFGVCKNKKMNQFFIINFNNYFMHVTKEEKKLYKEYCELFGKLEEYNKNEENNKNEFLYITKGEKYTNAIYQINHLILIASFNFFLNMEDVGNKLKNIMKFIREHENYYFTLFK